MTKLTPPARLDDRSYWRKLLARCHPDSGGSDALFVWVQYLRKAFVGGRFARANTDHVDRVNYDPSVAHHELTLRALRLGAGSRAA